MQSGILFQWISQWNSIYRAVSSSMIFHWTSRILFLGITSLDTCLLHSLSPLPYRPYKTISDSWPPAWYEWVTDPAHYHETTITFWQRLSHAWSLSHTRTVLVWSISYYFHQFPSVLLGYHSHTHPVTTHFILEVMFFGKLGFSEVTCENLKFSQLHDRWKHCLLIEYTLYSCGPP